MKLYLSSYKLGNKVEYLKEWISNNGNNIVLIPNSKDINGETEKVRIKIQEDVDSLKNIGFNVEVISLKKYFNDKEKLQKDFNKYKAFYVIGGNVFCLRKAMQLSGFDEYLKNKVNENILYAGYSAGISVLSKELKGLDIVDQPINPYNKDNVIYKGLGLINYIPIPHYKSNHKESSLIDECIRYFEIQKANIKPMKDGDVIIENIHDK